MALWKISEQVTTAVLLDASDASTRTIDVGVSELRDKSGNMRHAVQSTGSAQPSVSAAAQNGLDILIFDGSDDFLQGPLNLTLTAQAVFAVFSYENVNTYNRIYTQSDAGEDYSTSGMYIPILRDNATANIGSYISGSFALVSVPVSTVVQFSSIHTGAQIQNRLNDGTAATISNALNKLFTRYLIGSSTGASGKLSGKFCQLVVLNFEPSTVLRQQIVGRLAWKWGIEASLPSGHPYELAPPTDGLIRNFIEQPYYIIGNVLCALVDIPYSIIASYRTIIELLYSIRLGNQIEMRYGVATILRQIINQYYESAKVLKRSIILRYSDTNLLRAFVEQPWILPSDLRAICEQVFSIAGVDLRMLASLNYDLNEYYLLRRKIDQLWILPPGESLEQNPVVTTLINDINIPLATPATPPVPGSAAMDIPLTPYHITIDEDEDDFAIRGEMHVADEGQFLRCRHMETQIQLVIDGVTYNFIADSPRRSRQDQNTTEYYIPFVSPTIVLDAPYADTIDREFTGAMASVIAAEMAAIGSIDLDWQLVDWFIPSATLYASQETPLEIIRRLTEAVGGIIQSTPAGGLVCRPEYPISVNQWDTSTPSHYLTDMDNFFSVDGTPSIREGYNMFVISDQNSANEGLFLEAVDVNSTTKTIKVFQVPWDIDADITLETSGGSWVSVFYEGETFETLTELVEIVGGEGNTQKPIYQMVSSVSDPNYKQSDLGAMTWVEDGYITTAIAENSLVEIVYRTKYHKFRAVDARIEDVQFWPVENEE